MKDRHKRSAKIRLPWHESIARKEARRLRAQREGTDSVWFGLSQFGIVGWSVAIPMLMGIALGMWIDRTWPSRFSWTLMLLVLGVVLGCLNAWYWLGEQRRMIEHRKDSDCDSDV